jgi:hypothetical protein
MAIKRIRHKLWATRYHHFLVSRARMKFAWGQHDCALFAADGVLALTGVDIAAEFRGKYPDETGALAAIKTIAGGATIADAAAWCAAKHGFAELAHPKMAQRGDLVVFQGATGGNVAGLVHLSGQLVAAGEDGLYRFPISKVLRAWHYD